MELSAKSLEGIIPAIPTPFTRNDEVDEDGLRKLVNHVVRNGVHGIMTTGGNGEFPHLLADERKRVVEVVVDELSSKVPVIACTAACGTKETIEYTAHAKDSGAQAAIITPPYYFNVPRQSVYEHYKTVSGAVDLPIVVYNNPEYTGNNIDPALMAKISHLNNVIGLKQSNYDISQTLEIIRLVSGKISVLTGIDSQLFSTLSIGGRGVFSTAAAVIPRQIVQIYEAFKSGDVNKAYENQLKIQILNRFFEYDPGYVAPCKEALTMIGLPGGLPRKPLPSLTAEERTALWKALKDLGLLHG